MQLQSRRNDRFHVLSSESHSLPRAGPLFGDPGFAFRELNFGDIVEVIVICSHFLVFALHANYSSQSDLLRDRTVFGQVIHATANLARTTIGINARVGSWAIRSDVTLLLAQEAQGERKSFRCMQSTLLQRVICFATSVADLLDGLAVGVSALRTILSPVALESAVETDLTLIPISLALLSSLFGSFALLEAERLLHSILRW